MLNRELLVKLIKIFSFTPWTPPVETTGTVYETAVTSFSLIEIL
jgi:hypothetical protein